MTVIVKPADGMGELEAVQRTAAMLEGSEVFDYKSLVDGYKNGSVITFQDGCNAFAYLYRGAFIVRFDKAGDAK